MRFAVAATACVLVFGGPAALAFDMGKMPDLNAVKNTSLMEQVNKDLASQQEKDGQFEFKSGTAEFAPGNEQRVNGLLKVITDNSNVLKQAFPKLKVKTQGHTDSTGNAEANMKLSKERAETVCAELKAKGMTLKCVPQGVGSSKLLVKEEKTAADKQRNRRVLVQMME